MREKKVKTLVLIAVAFAAVSAFAFQPIPKESAKALGVTRGKKFSAGVVFINGKYVEPPYVVERWGTGIRINSIPVTGQVVDWIEFLKTQPGVRVEKSETAAAPEKTSKPVPEPAAAPAPAPAEDVDASSLDDLFDDDPKPAKSAKAATAPRAAVAAAPVASKPVRTSVTYVLSEKFRHNDDSKALLKRINANRTEIDRTLRSGGFICFGDSYSQVQGDRRTLMELLEVLPELQQRSPDVQVFCAKIREAKLVYLHEVLRRDLFRNRADYRKLRERREKLKSDQKWDQIIEEASDPLF